MGFWGSQSSLGVFIFFGIHGIHDVYYGGSIQYVGAVVVVAVGLPLLAVVLRVASA
jgi:uncharacterized membrane protein